MSKGAKSHTYHTNLFITYYYDVLGPIFFCGLKTKGLKSAWERNQKKARKCKRTQSEDDGANLTKSSCILTLWDGAGTEVYIVVDEHRKEKKKLVLWCSWIVYWIVPKQPSSLNFDVSNCVCYLLHVSSHCLQADEHISSMLKRMEWIWNRGIHTLWKMTFLILTSMMTFLVI